MKRFLFLIEHWRIIMVALFASVVASVMEIVGVSLVFPIIQRSGIPGNSADIPAPFNYVFQKFSEFSFPATLQIVAAILVISFGIKGGMLFLSGICSARLSNIIMKHFQISCFNRLMDMDMGYFNSQKAGDIHTIIVGHAKNVGVSLGRFLLSAHLIFTIAFLLAILIFLSWQVTLMSAFIAGGLVFTQRAQMRKLDHVSRKLGPATEYVGSTTLELILGLKIIRLFSRQRDALRSFTAAVDRLCGVYYDIARCQEMVTPLTQFTGIIGVAAILVVFSFSLGSKTAFGVDVLMVFLVAFNRMIGPINQINTIRAKFKGDLPYYKRVFQFLDKAGKINLRNGNKPFTGLRNGIAIKGLNFGYEAEKPILKDVCLDIPRGAKIGVAGASGAGKSTFTELLLRFYDPDKGQILIDGVNLKELDIHTWRERIGVVTQDIFLFNETIRANICFAKPDATQDEVESAARKAHAHEFVREMPKGYDTLVGDRGVRLSGGQKQRIALARAIIIDPEILIFDEATSALDTASERVVQQALEEVGAGRTVVSIAHRLSTIFHSDKIFVMDSGRIAEQGTHEELLEAGGIYSKLVRMQEPGKKSLGINGR